MTKMTKQILRIVAAGGGVILNAQEKTTPQLVQIASAAAGSGATVILKNADTKTTEQLVQIATAGNGRVIFEL